MFVPPSTGLRSQGVRLTTTPSGTPMPTALAFAMPTSHRCTAVSDRICARLLYKKSSMLAGQSRVLEHLGVPSHSGIAGGSKLAPREDAHQRALIKQGYFAAQQQRFVQVMG